MVDDDDSFLQIGGRRIASETRYTRRAGLKPK